MRASGAAADCPSAEPRLCAARACSMRSQRNARGYRRIEALRSPTRDAVGTGVYPSAVSVGCIRRLYPSAVSVGCIRSGGSLAGALQAGRLQQMAALKREKNYKKVQLGGGALLHHVNGVTQGSTAIRSNITSAPGLKVMAQARSPAPAPLYRGSFASPGFSTRAWPHRFASAPLRPCGRLTGGRQAGCAQPARRLNPPTDSRC